MSSTTGVQIEDSLEEGIASVHALLDQGDIENARRLLARLQERWPDADQARRLAHAIAPPTAAVRPGRRARSRIREYAWLREHAHEYPGHWLAIYEDQLVAADPDLQAVLATARESVGEQKVLLHKQAPARDSQ
jgi:hypothetical protein